MEPEGLAEDLVYHGVVGRLRAQEVAGNDEDSELLEVRLGPERARKLVPVGVGEPGRDDREMGPLGASERETFGRAGGSHDVRLERMECRTDRDVDIAIFVVDDEDPRRDDAGTGR